MKPRLLFYREPETAWRQALLPWFRFWPREAWRQDRPVIFLAPDSSVIAWVKSRLVQAGIPALGLEFYTPGALRSFLRAGGSRPLALREDLRLLMELAAGELPDNPVAQAAAQEPSDFLRHCDRLETAGWEPTAFDVPEARELAERFYALVNESGMQTSAATDRSLLTVQGDPPLAQVMAYGFGPGQSGSLTLLRGLPDVAESVAYCLPMVGDQPDELIWRSTLEQWGEGEELASEEPRPLAELSQAAEFYQHLNDSNNPVMQVALATDIATEARVIENEIHRWRGDLSPGERIGVVFARDGLPLAREVARLLADAGLAHQDEIGHQPGRRPAQVLVEAWLAYQDRGDADSARNFIRALRRAGRLSVKEEYAVWRTLEKAFSDAMTPDLAVLLPMLSRMDRGDVAMRVLAEWPLLPKQASFGEYTALCQPVLNKLRWPERIDAWEHRASTLAENLRRPLGRAQYLRWLTEVCRIPGRTRPGIGREAFAPIVLTTVDRAVAQSWQYIVFAGLNRGDWPAEQSESLLLSARLSSRLNARASMDSPVGLGQQCLRPGKSWLASSLDERRRFSENCASLLTHVQVDALFTAHRDNPSEPGREQDLADWLNRLFYAQFGQLPGDDELREAAELAAEVFADDAPNPDAFPEITLAWGKRRDPKTAFDQYSFCFAEAPAQPLQLSSRGWEDALRWPGHAWFRHVLRVKPLEELQTQDPRAMATGNWAHAWVQPPGKGQAFIPSPDAETWAKLVERQAQQFRQTVADAYAGAGRSLPDWWLMDWNQARRWAHQFIEPMIELAWASMAGEWTLHKKPMKLPGHPLDGLTLSGRIDALLCDDSAENLNHAASGDGPWPDRAAVWIVDFKTGGDQELTARKLQKGEGIQLALYALAMHADGAERVQTSLLRPGAELSPQVALEQILTLEEPWEVIRKQAFSGCFGLRGEQRSEYSFCGNYPIAHLLVKPSVLEAKWALTHPEG